MIVQTQCWSYLWFLSVYQIFSRPLFKPFFPTILVHILQVAIIGGTDTQSICMSTKSSREPSHSRKETWLSSPWLRCVTYVTMPLTLRKFMSVLPACLTRAGHIPLPQMPPCFPKIESVLRRGDDAVSRPWREACLATEGHVPRHGLWGTIWPPKFQQLTAAFLLSLGHMTLVNLSCPKMLCSVQELFPHF